MPSPPLFLNLPILAILFLVFDCHLRLYTSTFSFDHSFPGFNSADGSAQGEAGNGVCNLSKRLYPANCVVVRDKRIGKTKGYGFVSFAHPSELAGALKEMNGKYVGNRPGKLHEQLERELILKPWKDKSSWSLWQNHKDRKSKLSKNSVLHK